MSKGSVDASISTYYVGIHFVVCYGPIDKITKIFVGDKLAWEGVGTTGQITINKPELFGGNSREGGVKGTVSLALGENSLVPNSYMVGLHGEYPSYRKITSMYLEQVYVGTNYYLKSWTVEAERIHTLEDGKPQWYDAVAELSSNYYLHFTQITSGSPGTEAVIRTFKGHGITTATQIIISGANESEYNGTFYPTSTDERTVTITLPTPYIGEATGNVKVQVVITGLINAVHILREILTNPTWGYGHSEALIPDSVWMPAALQCYNEGLGFGFFWDSNTTTLKKFAETVAEHINAEVYQNATDGLFYITLIRKLEDTSGLPILDRTTIKKVTNLDIKALGDLVSSYTVNYKDNLLGASNSTTVQDTALQVRQVVPVEKSKTYTGVVDLATAHKLAVRDHRSLRTPLLTCKVHCTRIARTLNKGDAFKLDFPDYLDSIRIMRVVSIDLGTSDDSKAVIDCIEDTFEAAGLTYIEPKLTAWESPINAPAVASLRVVEEMPYYVIATVRGDAFAQGVVSPETYIAVGAGKPTADSYSAGIWTSTSTDYLRRGVTDLCFTALLVTAISKTDVNITLTNIRDIELISVGSFLQIGTEYLGIVSIAGSSLEVIRGVCDTVPEAHTTNEVIFGWHDFGGTDGLAYVAGETVNVKLTTITPEGELDPLAAPIDNITLEGRMHLPYPPGNFKVDNLYWPDEHLGGTITLTWAHRNRYLQTAGLVDYYTGSITSEAGVTYSCEVIRTDTSEVLDSFTGETGTTRDITPQYAASNYYGEIKISLWSVTANGDSYQTVTHVMTLFADTLQDEFAANLTDDFNEPIFI